MEEQIVKVSLLQKRGLRFGRGEPTIWYLPGVREMPLAHAKLMGLEDRIVRELPSFTEAAPAELAFDGRFNEKLTNRLLEAGYSTLADLAAAGDDKLRALKLGPAAYEQIHAALNP